VIGITPSRERGLDEVKDQVEAKWRDDQISARLRTKATEMVQKLEQGGKLADEAAAAGLKVETAVGFKRDASPAGVPSGAITAAFRSAKDGVGQTPGSGGSEWIVFRVSDVTVPPVDLSSDDMKKLKETLERAMTDEQVAQYVTRLEKDIGTSINEDAFAQVTGANN
jgi:peptidyl-prolyl cis-trans isomerase D